MIAIKFLRWIKIDGEEMDGLKRRRKIEAALWKNDNAGLPGIVPTIKKRTTGNRQSFFSTDKLGKHW